MRWQTRKLLVLVGCASAATILFFVVGKSYQQTSETSRMVITGILASMVSLLLVFICLLSELSDRKSSQEALARSEKWFSSALSSVGDAVIATDINGTVNLLNSAAQSLTGWKLEEARGKSMDLVFNIVHTESRRPIENLVEQVFRKGKADGLADHTLLLCKDGREFEIEYNSAPILAEGGAAFGVVIVFRDITGKNQAERETKRQKQLLQLIVESIADGVVVADSQGKFVLFNAAAKQVVGIGATDTTPEQWSDQYGVYFPDSVTPYPPHQLPLTRAMRGESVDAIEIVVRNAAVPQGRLLSVTGRPLRDEDGALHGGVVVLGDITERRRAELALRQSEERYHLLFDSNPHTVCVYDLETLAFLDVNQSAIRNFGYSREEFLSLTIKDVHPPEEIPAVLERIANMPPVTETGGFWKQRKKDGTLMDVEISSHPIVYGGRRARLVVSTDITERKQAQVMLEKSEMRLAGIVKSAMDAIISIDEDQRITLFNPAAEKLFGWPATEVVGQPIDCLIPVRFQAAHGGYIRGFANSGVTARGMGLLPTLVGRRASGEEFPIEATISQFEVGGRRLFTAIIRDISERKQAEEALKASEQRLNLALDAAQLGIWELDLVNDKAYRNLRHDQIFGYESLQPDWGRETFFTHVVPKDREAVNKSFEKAFATGDLSMECQIVWPDKSIHWISAQGHVFRNDKGDPVRMMGTVTDVTERKRAEHKLQLITAQQDAILNSANFSIISVDTKGTIRTFNAPAERMLQYKTEEMVGKVTPAIFHDAEEMARRAQQLTQELGIPVAPGFEVFVGKTVRTDLPDENEWTYIRKDGTRFPVFLSVTTLRDTAGNIQGFMGVAEDITERKRTEQIILRAKEEAERASKFKDQFLSTMSHELRTPLNAVLGFSDLLADERYGSLNDRQQRYVGHIHAGGKHLLKLISDILDISKIEAGRMELACEDVAIAPAFAEVLSALYPLAEKKSQSLRQQVETNFVVRADATRFKQVLMNLVGNAIKFTPEGGRIEIVAHGVDDRVRVTVRDTGPGIPLEHQQRIFEAFFRAAQSGTATEGTGLGLAITARLVELHGSKLEIETPPGGGTCFYFFLPLVTSVVEKPSRPITAGSKLGKAPRVLIVEDNNAIGQLIQSQLGSSGYETIRCDQSDLAVEMAVRLQPDAITLDLLMKPVHGLDVLLQLKNDPCASNIPVIVVTIVDQTAIGTILGADEYLVKPVDKSTLLSAVERCLQLHGGPVPGRAILVVEDDVPTREMIVELLTVHGYAVRTASDGVEAQASVAQSLPELVILDLVLPKKSGFELLAEWRANPRTAELSVFVLTSKDLSKEEEKYVRAHAESLFRKQDSWRGPLIKQLERVVTSIPVVGA
jgi:PAS domain S-box-containing protein